MLFISCFLLFVVYLFFFVFFFKQKSAYELLISDWSSDVCSSDLDACLARIAALNHRLQAFQVVDADRARQAARAVDELLAAGTDLGPLMGVPIAVKDIIAVEGLPTSNGSKLPSEHLTGPEGPLVGQLKAAGCVILGKTRTVEFALGATGVNEARGTPWNPWDATVHRFPGGSSSGSAVAVAAGLFGFALGTDTGGSIRIPARFCGLFGHTTTIGLWQTAGAFPLSPTSDPIEIGRASCRERVCPYV